MEDDWFIPYASHWQTLPRINARTLMDTLKNELTKLGRLLRRTEAAKYLTETYGIPCSPKTLAKLACVSSSGPPFHKAGAYPLYPMDGLDDWAHAKIGPRVRSTAEITQRILVHTNGQQQKLKSEATCGQGLPEIVGRRSSRKKRRPVSADP
jgi:hypothetical protein